MRQFSFSIGTLLLCGFVLPTMAQNIITTVAGTDVVFPADGRPGGSVALGRDAYVAVDPQGRAVFSDLYYNVVVRVETDGTLRVIAGNNVQGLGNTVASGFGGSAGGFSGDNGPATSAALNRPRGIAYDSQGNLYIADSFNNRIRVVNTSGIISTFAGSGAVGFQDGPAASAQFNLPLSIAIDSSGAVILNDSGNNRIRKIVQGRVTTIAGNGQFTCGRPLPDNVPATTVALGDIEGLATDAQGNIYFSDFIVGQVKEITRDNVLVTIASNGTTNGLSYPSGIAIDSSGAIYVAVTGSHQIRKIVSGALTTIAGTGTKGYSGDGGPALGATFHNPAGVAVTPAGVVYVADRDNFRIRRIDAAKNVSTVAGNGSLLFSADGKQAIYAPLLDPFGVTSEVIGNLLVADTHNNLVRNIDASRTLTTIAGNGALEDGDENVPATQAGLAGPVNVNRDAAGNLLIADQDGSLIRQVSTKNIITNFAGAAFTCAAGDPGNGKPATSAILLQPTQAVTDSNGNTYIADYGAGNIRIVSRDHIINTFKSGLKGPYGLALDNLNNLYVTEYDGGTVSMIPITANGAGSTVLMASGLKHPAGITVDAARNVYFTDAGDNRVRRLTPTGGAWTLSIIAGNGQAGYAGDGGLATNASLRAPFGVSVDSKSGTVYVADTANNRIRAVQSIAPALSISKSSLTFTANQGGAVSDVQTIDVNAESFGHLAGMLFTASASQSWISVTPALGATPATLQISVDPSTLAAKTYNETVTISAPGANPPALTVAITVTVSAPPPPALSLDTSAINAGLNAGGQPLVRQIQVLNSGGQQPQVTAVATMQTGALWLSVSPTAGSASATAPAILTVTITPANLAPGVYTGQITVTSGGKQVGAIPVNIAVNAKPGRLLLSSNALSFTAIKGGGAPLSKTINLVNAGTGSLAWKASGASLTANTPNWLSLDTGGGTLDTPQTSVSTVNASVTPGTLGIGTYYGQIQITSDTAANSPQFVTVVLKVVDSASENPGPDISATALVFPGVQGANPSSQTVRISNLGSLPLAYGSTHVSEDGDWIVHVPSDATIDAGQTARIVVQPDFTNLAAGTHRGTITLRFADKTVRTIDVLSIVAPGAAADAATTSGPAPRAAPGCASNPLVIAVISPQQNFSIPVNPATSVQASITDCNSGKAVPASSITVTATCGGQAYAMKNAHDAIWTVDWSPANPGNNVSIFVAAGGTIGTQPVAGTSTKNTGTVTAGSNAPRATGLANAASYATTPVAPGAYVTIFGTNLANTTTTANSLPLGSPLAGATVKLSGRPLPILYASSTQINAQVPYDLPQFSEQLLSVQRDQTLSDQVQFVVGRAQPAIYTNPPTGHGQGIIVFANTVTFADVAQPAKAGDLLTIYCNGLGPVQGNVDAGTAVSGPTPTIDPATVTIGGVNATVTYAGLTPGIPGLYQINVQVPDGITPGDAVPVSITISDQTSPDGVTIAVR